MWKLYYDTEEESYRKNSNSIRYSDKVKKYFMNVKGKSVGDKFENLIFEYYIKKDDKLKEIVELEKKIKDRIKKINMLDKAIIIYDKLRSSLDDLILSIDNSRKCSEVIISKYSVKEKDMFSKDDEWS